MAHWFDKLSDHSVAAEDHQALSRRRVLKTGAAGLVGAGVLGSPSLAAASDGVADLLRESACKCHDRADARYERAMGGYIEGIFTGDPAGVFLYFYNFAKLGVDAVAFAGISAGYSASKVACGTCKRASRGDNKPAPPSYSRRRASVRLRVAARRTRSVAR